MDRIQVKSAGAVVYYIEKGVVYFLLLKHIKTGTHWGFPKGKVNEGESELQGAKREIFEETGIKEIAFEPDFREEMHYTFEKEGVIRDKTVTYFLTQVTAKSAKLSKEHTEFCWADYDNAINKLAVENDISILKKARDYINVKSFRFRN